MGRIGRSFQLVAQSYRILMQDKELMVLPLISGIVIAVVVAFVAFGFSLNPLTIRRIEPQMYPPLFVMYVLAYAIGIFFQAAVIAGATERMRGGDPTVGSSLAAAGRRLGPILMWAVVAATVGILLRMIQERLGVIGKIVTSIVGAVWSLATFFIVPVLVLEERSVADAFGRSASVFKQTWGETVVGGVTLSAAGVCAWLTLITVTGLLAWAVGNVALFVFGAGAILLMIFFSALQGIYVASLYRYATDREAPPGFDRALFDSAFVPKKV
jgi:hypothetical protein